MSADAFFLWTELDRTTFSAWRDTILAAEATWAANPGEPRTYPGYARWPLPRLRPRLWPPLDRALLQRRCLYPLGDTLPSQQQLSRLLHGAHGITGKLNRGPAPSAGGLQALELYLVVLLPGWLPSGVYHYDRAGHHLSQIAQNSSRAEFELVVPSLELIEGGSVLWVLVGDATRVRAKYSERGARFLLLEAGHLMQNICLLSATLGLVTIPLGGVFERELARRMQLPDTDLVLYAGLCGQPP